jgi:NhaP-type Na+/H+ or K+/H+ antiporter
MVLLGGLGLLILGVAWLPALVRGFPLTLPIACVTLGFILFSIPETGPDPDLLEHPHLTERLSELTLIVALMSAGLKLNRPLGRRAWATTWRLLGFAMPLSIAAIALLGSGLLGLTAASALLLGAVLAPTDPVLASSVQVGPPQDSEEDEVRFALTSEAGLNDGLAFPFVHLAIAVAVYGAGFGAWTGEWLSVAVLWRTAAGIGVGLLVGQALGYVIFRYIEGSQIPETGDTLVALGITLLVYGLAELVQGYGFLAVFATALTLRHQERSHHYRARLHEFAEQLERLFMMILLVLFGGALAGGLLAPLTWGAAAVGLLSLLAVRPVVGARRARRLGAALRRAGGDQLLRDSRRGFVLLSGLRIQFRAVWRAGLPVRARRFRRTGVDHAPRHPGGAGHELARPQVAGATPLMQSEAAWQPRRSGPRAGPTRDAPPFDTPRGCQK